MSRIKLIPYNSDRLHNLCGSCNENIKILSQSLQVEIHHRDHIFNVTGSKENVAYALQSIKQLYQKTESIEHIDAQEVAMTIQFVLSGQDVDNFTPQLIKTPKMTIATKNSAQSHFIKKMSSGIIHFGIGPAGTGKTFLAVAFGLAQLLTNQVERIILTRPAVDAGEKLGFLPGDLSQKVDPYLRPIYDALYCMLSVDKVNQLIEKGNIEIAPLAFMRGRTLARSFIILDEAQNTSILQMKMLLTRIGFDSKVVINGDLTQIDLPKHIASGLADAKLRLGEIHGISFTYFSQTDVARHPLICDIIKAYE